MYEGETDDLMLIKKENEQLLEGINPPVSPMDKHSVHIDEHSAVLADPDLRTDPNFINTVMDHIQGHLQALRETDPALLQIRGNNLYPLFSLIMETLLAANLILQLPEPSQFVNARWWPWWCGPAPS